MIPDPVKLRIKCARSLGIEPWLECQNHGEVGQDSAVFYVNGPTVCPWCGSDLIQRDFPNFPAAFDGAASLLIAAAKELGFVCELSNLYAPEWECWFERCAGTGREAVTHYARAESLPEAICLAWLALQFRSHENIQRT